MGCLREREKVCFRTNKQRQLKLQKQNYIITAESCEVTNFFSLQVEQLPHEKKTKAVTLKNLDFLKLIKCTSGQKQSIQHNVTDLISLFLPII